MQAMGLVSNVLVAFKIGQPAWTRNRDSSGSYAPASAACSPRVIGIGDYKQNAEALATRLGLGSRVIFQGRISGERLRPVLTRFAVGLAPNLASHAIHLMLLAKLLEYVACGIPVVAARLQRRRACTDWAPEDRFRNVLVHSLGGYHVPTGRSYDGS
jgi:Glycosyl transferases group 1